MKGGGSERVVAHARRLLARRDVLARQLAAVDAQIDEVRRTYSFSRGYRVPLRVEAFKAEVTA